MFEIQSCEWSAQSTPQCSALHIVSRHRIQDVGMPGGPAPPQIWLFACANKLTSTCIAAWILCWHRVHDWEHTSSSSRVDQVSATSSVHSTMCCSFVKVSWWVKRACTVCWAQNFDGMEVVRRQDVSKRSVLSNVPVDGKWIIRQLEDSEQEYEREKLPPPWNQTYQH